MFEIIKHIIVQWDPIDLMEFAPSDEYDDECRLIVCSFTSNDKTLGKIIYDIFKSSFSGSFETDLPECIVVAAKIIAQVNQT